MYNTLLADDRFIEAVIMRHGDDSLGIKKIKNKAAEENNLWVTRKWKVRAETAGRERGQTGRGVDT